MCYVGKATKIFFVLVGALMVVGLVVGLGLVRHGWAHKAAPRSFQSSAGCRPIFPDPIPADAATAAANPADAFGAPPPPSLPAAAQPPSSLPAALTPPSVAPPPAPPVQPPSVEPPTPAVALRPVPPQPPTFSTDIPSRGDDEAAQPLVGTGPPSSVSEPLGPARA